jgi:hypothetical protein
LSLTKSSNPQFDKMQAALCPNAVVASKPSVARNARRSVTVQAAAYNGQFAEELVQTAVSRAASVGCTESHGVGAAAQLTPCGCPRCLPAAEQDRQPRQGHPG